MPASPASKSRRRFASCDSSHPTRARKWPTREAASLMKRRDASQAVVFETFLAPSTRDRSPPAPKASGTTHGFQNITGKRLQPAFIKARFTPSTAAQKRLEFEFHTANSFGHRGVSEYRMMKNRASGTQMMPGGAVYSALTPGLHSIQPATRRHSLLCPSEEEALRR